MLLKSIYLQILTTVDSTTSLVIYILNLWRGVWLKNVMKEFKGIHMTAAVHCRAQSEIDTLDLLWELILSNDECWVEIADAGTWSQKLLEEMSGSGSMCGSRESCVGIVEAEGRAWGLYGAEGCVWGL